ncbi:MAG: 3-deoxy-D-manno-octulosonic acid kinase [Desulfovermiculus sp.]|nr:3-deoxy-D-manno-octulosonic acid kinase [Desulfovermiculus sp.]
MHQQVHRHSWINNEYFLYDQRLLSNLDGNFFSPDCIYQQGRLLGRAQGRGNAYAFVWNQRQFFLRHYRRGGAIAPVMKDVYVWTGLERTRAWREFTLLQAMQAQGLPVPKPIAAHVQQTGFFYRADIVTERIREATPLSILLTQVFMPKGLWIKIGKCLRRFHTLGIVHADLNAHNILLDAHESVWLIDFDKGVWKNPSPSRQKANLNRLRRSLDKVWPVNASLHNVDHAWTLLLQGYSMH